MAQGFVVYRSDLAENVDGLLTLVAGKRTEELLVDLFGWADQAVEQVRALIREAQ
ncbi:hypothetical protein ACF06Q_08185 [Streptomyces leeuwenhoekii]|uniref:hypothetical protein n=1 Tax=Streptomyces leeuwenhoekii TaxID=1437453 RepID=UPI0036FE1AC8